MRTKDLFKVDRSAKRINESIEKVFGKKLNLESFELDQLQDARNKLRTQLSQQRASSEFNENIENDAYTKAQWMLDAINAEISHREEFIVDSVQEDDTGKNQDVGPQIGKAILANYKYSVDDSYSEQDLQKLVNVAKIYINKGERAGLQAQLQSGLGDLIDEVLSKANASHLRTMWDLDEESQDSNLDEAYIKTSKDAINTLGALRKIGKSIETGQSTYDGNLANMYVNDVYDVISWLENNADTSDAEFKQVIAPVIELRKKAKGMERESGSGKDARFGNEIVNTLYPLMQWIEMNVQTEVESIDKDNEMTKLRESEIDQASAIVTANTMVDRLGRWIEELSGMENETLLQLGDSIRDQMGQEQSRQFIEAVAPTLQSALETLKSARESVSGAVRSLATGESPDAMLGAPDDMDADLDMTDPDAMNAGDLEVGPEEPVDDFDAAEPAAGGLETAGREKRESIDFQNRLLKVLAG
jgi:hypothetical protein